MSAHDPSMSSYPPPPSETLHSTASHPFYQPLDDPARLGTPHSQQTNRTVGPHGSQSPDARQDAHQQHYMQPGSSLQTPEDPQLRASIGHMLSGQHGVSDTPQHPYTPPGAHQINGLPHLSMAASPLYSQHSQQLQRSQEKRTKVSRACDECRRKKIRCDAPDETGETPCSSCARTGVTCLFSRQPMKRGPSKGYIKELAERLGSLEGMLQQNPAGPGVEGLGEELRRAHQAVAAEGVQLPPLVPVEPRTGEKRTHDGLQPQGSRSNQPIAPWGSQTIANRPTYVPQAPPAANMLPEKQGPAESVQPFWRHGATDNFQAPQGLEADGTTATTITNFDWDEAVIDEYFRIIHQTFPILPSNKNRLRQRLSDCPASLREAFITALDCLMRTFPTTNLAPNAGYSQAIRRAAELLARYPFDNPSSHTNATNLIYLQTLILMALECDNHGPATIRGQAGPSRSEWLGRAAGVAGSLEINLINTNSLSVMEGDRDSEERLARRVWWVLFILDRWHASSTADLLKLPENSVVLLPEDQILLGESTYHLARLSFIIGHLAAILTTTKTPSTNVMAPSNPASSLLGLTLAGEIDRFRESVESVWGSLNLVHLSYHHCHLLIKRLNPTTEPTELVGHAVKVATVLNSRMTPLTPLNHQFGALAAMTLCELCDVPKTRDEAMKGIEQMVESLSHGRGLAGKSGSEGWDGAVRELVVEKRRRMVEAGGGSAQAAATETTTTTTSVTAGGSSERHDVDGHGFDPTVLTRYGYLTALGQGMFKTR